MANGGADGIGDGLRMPRDLSSALDELGRLPTYTRLVWGLMRDDRVPLMNKAVLGAALAYVTLPVDVIPDWVPLVGQLDDLAAILLGVDWFLRNAPRTVVEEHLARSGRHEDVMSGDLDRAEELLADRMSELRATLERVRSHSRGGENV